MTAARWPSHWSKTKRRRAAALAKAGRDYANLLIELGAYCHNCFVETERLQIDHADGRTIKNHDPRNRNLRWDVRVRNYVQEHKSGVRLRVLCINCNSADGRRRQLEESDDAPF